MHLSQVGHVERHHLHGRGEPAELGSQVAGAADPGADLLRAAGGQLMDERQADTAVRAGDERDRAGVPPGLGGRAG